MLLAYETLSYCVCGRLPLSLCLSLLSGAYVLTGSRTGSEKRHAMSNQSLTLEVEFDVSFIYQS